MAKLFRLSCPLSNGEGRFIRPKPPKWLIDCYMKPIIENTSQRYWTKIYWATPPWLNDIQIERMRKIYTEAPKGSHVDHIVPLKSKLVCGLHVPWNLEAIPEARNLHKSNNMWPGHPYENMDLFE